MTAAERRIVSAPPRVPVDEDGDEFAPRRVGEQLTDGNGMLDVYAYWSDIDDRLVVQIDTSQPVRVYLNDGDLYDGDPEADDSISAELASVVVDVLEQKDAPWRGYDNPHYPMADPEGWQRLRDRAEKALRRIAARYR